MGDVEPPKLACDTPASITMLGSWPSSPVEAAKDNDTEIEDW